MGHLISVMTKVCFTVRLTSQTVTQVGHSDPVISLWNGHRSTNKSYSRDNRLMSPERSYRRARLAPRCRLILSWRCSCLQGFGCSPSKKVRELG